MSLGTTQIAPCLPHCASRYGGGDSPIASKQEAEKQSESI